MRRLVVVLCVLTALTPAPEAAAQAPAPPPPTDNRFFGAPAAQPFNESAIFVKPPTPAVPSKPPAEPALVEPNPWSGGVELGLNGSSGNADVFNIRAGFNAKRTTDSNILTANFLYLLTNQEGRTTKDQALLNARDEILFAGSPYSLFSALQVEYDQFRAYDFRVGTYAGVGYQFLKTDWTNLKGRLGAGAVREIGGNPEPGRVGTAADRWVPEAVVGFDYEQKINDRQQFVTTLDVFPNLSQLGQYRVRARAAYEIILDEKKNILLRMGVQDRYDSNPGPARRNDLDYFTSLLMKF